MTTYTNFLKLRAQDYDQQNWDVMMNENLAIIDFITGALNSKNRVASGGLVSIGTGLNADYTALVVQVGGSVYTIAAGSVACIASALNYIYVDAAGTVMATTAAPTGDYVPLALVDTGAVTFLRVSDVRPIGVYTDIRLYQTVAQTISPGVWTKVLFQNKHLDLLSEFDFNNSRFQPLTSGKYLVTAYHSWLNSSIGERHLLSAYKNGSQNARLDDEYIGSNGLTSSSGGVVLNLNTNDYVEFYVYTNFQRDSVPGSINTYLTITRLI